MNNIVTIEGYRQRGKTHTALALAAADAQHGRTVVWVGHNQLAIRDAFQLLLDRYLHPDLVQKAWRGNGAERIHVEPLYSDKNSRIDQAIGRILFKVAGHRHVTEYATETPGSRHTFIFDETHIPYGFVRANPEARIYVTVLPPGGDDL